jgi:protein-L-isoaspartate(D-aspartate) O-methyltransferase
MTNERLKERHLMVKEQLEQRGIRNPWLLQAMLDIPRHLFVPAEQQDNAYEDGPLPIGHGQTISQPYVVAAMVERIEPLNTDRVLEVGLGSGYSTAVLSRLVQKAYAIDREPSFIHPARERFRQLGISNVEAKEGDGTLGWPEEAPFDAIVVTAAGPQIPPSLLQQLKVDGRLVMPIGDTQRQVLKKVVKESSTSYKDENIFDVRFVPLVGKEGWPK